MIMSQTPIPFIEDFVAEEEVSGPQPTDLDFALWRVDLQLDYSNNLSKFNWIKRRRQRRPGAVARPRTQDLVAIRAAVAATKARRKQEAAELMEAAGEGHCLYQQSIAAFRKLVPEEPVVEFAAEPVAAAIKKRVPGSGRHRMPALSEEERLTRRREVNRAAAARFAARKRHQLGQVLKEAEFYDDKARKLADVLLDMAQEPAESESGDEEVIPID